MPLTFRIGTWLLKAIFWLLSRCQVRSKENIPLQGPLIIVANHLHNVDPPLLAATIPRLTVFMAKEELFRSRWLSPVIRWFRAFPVHRGQTDRKALRQASAALEQGLALAMFPEGTRSPTSQLRAGEPGAAFVALRSPNVPILPVGIFGTEKLKGWAWLGLRPRITLNIGQPFTLPPTDGKLTKAQLTLATDLIMAHIAALLPPEYRGVYSKADRHDLGSRSNATE